MYYTSVKKHITTILILKFYGSRVQITCFCIISISSFIIQNLNHLRVILVDTKYQVSIVVTRFIVTIFISTKQIPLSIEFVICYIEFVFVFQVYDSICTVILYITFCIYIHILQQYVFCKLIISCRICHT